MTTSPFPIEFKSSNRSEGSSSEELSPPSGLCFTDEGHLLLADDFNHRIQVYDSQFNLLHCFGSKGKELGQFQYPKGIAVDPEGNIFVADSWNHRIQKFDAKGTPLLAFGTCGDGEGELNEPYDIMVEPSGNLIVVERYNHRIQFFTPQGVSLGWIGDRGTVLEDQLAEIQGTPATMLAPPLFELPTSITKDSRGNYFITDSGNHRVRKFDPQWQEIISFGEKGSAPGQFQYPLCVSVAPNDLLYVADLNNERVQVFSPFGQYLFSIDSAPDQDFKAPCLTAIDLKGCLHIGFTFNTQIFKYLIPLASQNTLAESLSVLPNPDPSHIFYHALSLEQENDNTQALIALEKTLTRLNENRSEEMPLASDLKMNTSLQLSHLSKKGITITDTTLNLAYKFAEEQLRLIRDEAIKSFESWQVAALKFSDLLHEEQRKIVKDPDGIRDFNLDIHIAEQEDKKSYRLTRNKIYSFRETVRKFSRIIHNLIESNLPRTQLDLLNEVLLQQTGESLNCMKEYFRQKEKSEESMVQVLGEPQGETDKLSSFITQFYSNSRIMDLQTHLQFELQSHWFNLRTLAANTPVNVSLENFAGKMTGDSSAFEDLLKVLIGFHEDWISYPLLEQQFLNSLDTLSRTPAFDDAILETELTLSDLSPVPFDSENLDFSSILTALIAEGLPLSKEFETLIWGQRKFQLQGFSEHKEELVHCTISLMETQTTYQRKARELFQQLEEMLQKQIDLEVQLKQVRVEDKVSPITINDNIAIQQFQIHLLRRMIMSMDINQSINLHRLVLAGAFLSLADNDDSKAQEFFEVFNDYHSQQNQQIHENSKSCKENTLKVYSQAVQAKELNSKYEISKLSDSARVENENRRSHIALDHCELEYQRNSRVKNILDRLVDFRSRLSPSYKKTDFREIRILEKANVSIGHTLNPHGIHYNQDGDLLVINFEDHRVYSYSPLGYFQFHFGGWGNAPEKLQNPGNLVTDRKGSIYIVLEGARIVKKFSKAGTFLLQFTLKQSGVLYSPSIDSQNNLWVADPENNQVWIMNDQGKTLKTLQGKELNIKEPVSIYCLPNGEYLVGDKSEFLLKHFDASSNLIQKVDRAKWGVDDIYFLAWHPKHGIYGADYWNNQIVHLNNKLEVQSVYQKPGNRAGQLGKVAGLSIFNDQLAVAYADRGKGKVQIFDLSS